jgi:acyl-coenzyme A thioesterase PaaI-like protein
MNRAEGGKKPLSRDPEAHLRSVPFTRVCGAQWVGGSRVGKAIEVCLRLPFASRVSDHAGAAIDERAVMALLDHAGGVAVYAARPEPSPTATMDLRVAFHQAVPPGAAVVARARVVHMAPGVAFVEGRAEVDGAEEGAPALASVSGSFIVGAHPGGAGGGASGTAELWQPAREFQLDDDRDFASYEELLGIARHGTHVRMEYADRLIGAVSLPALHGGSVASLLAIAAGDLAAEAGASRLAAITIQYLRAGRAETTSAAAEWDKRGKRSGVVGVVARQAHGSREVARAQCTFVAD